MFELVFDLNKVFVLFGGMIWFEMIFLVFLLIFFMKVKGFYYVKFNVC